MQSCQHVVLRGQQGMTWAAAQIAVVPAHGKCLVKIGLAMALPPGSYGRVAPRSGLALKHFMDVGAGVIDSDYRGELGVILFNFSDYDFVVNMGDRIAQLIVEKIKTPKIKEIDSLEGTDRGAKGYGSTSMNAEQKNEIVKSVQNVLTDEEKAMETKQKEVKSAMNEKTSLYSSRRLITA